LPLIFRSSTPILLLYYLSYEFAQYAGLLFASKHISDQKEQNAALVYQYMSISDLIRLELL